MRDDIEGLEISRQELQELINLPVKDELVIITNYLQKSGKRLIEKIKGTEGATVAFIGFSVSVFSYLILDILVKVFFVWLNLPGWLVIAIFALWLGGMSQTILYFIWRRKSKLLKVNMTNSLRILLNDVDRYNAVIKAININDQIEAAGNPGVSIQQRDRVIEALRLTRSDLIRALKTERILRENKNFILNNADLFANNLANLAAMQVTEQATEHGKLLNEALQIALDVQHEMRRLQGSN
ncbi:MAG TPA: hypothetical protein VK184_20405 [Nostocaceae cyanobacterium]|nr:hypothetical protein [Nostocaceae cyanobacterium]